MEVSIHKKEKNVNGQNETRYASEISQIKCSESEYIKYLQPNKNEQESCPIKARNVQPFSNQDITFHPSN